jgi:mono/diheme cytochrome c family protein
MIRLITLGVLLMLILVGCGGLAGEPEIIATLPPRPTTQPISQPAQAPDLALGAQIYAENCTACHGIGGAGDGEMVQNGQIQQIVNFTDAAEVTDVPLSEYFRIITEGKIENLMPPWANALTESERWAVAFYVYTLPVTGAGDEQAAETQLAAFANQLDSAYLAAVSAYTGAPVIASAAEPVSTAEADATSEAVAVGIVRGRLDNGSSGGGIPPAQDVILHVVDAEFNDQPMIATAGEDGTYEFTNVPLLPDHDYVVTTRYNDVVFGSEIVKLEPGMTELTLDTAIYETTDDPAAIEIDSMMAQLGVIDGHLQMVQLVSFQNTGDRVFIQQNDTETRSVGMYVPRGAQYFDYMGGNYTLSADGTQVFDSTPIIPGQTHVMHLSYMLPYDGSASVQIDQMMDYALAGSVEVIIATDGLRLDGDQFTVGEPRNFSGMTMASYSASLNNPPAQSVSFAISGSPVVAQIAPVATESEGINPLAYVLIAAGAWALGMSGFLYYRERKQRAAAVAGDPGELTRQIAELDIQHQAGKLDKQAYEQRRAALKAQLTLLLKKQQS